MSFALRAPKRTVNVALQDMKEAVEDEYGAIQWPLYFHRRTEKRVAGKVFPRKAKKISSFRKNGDRLEFLVHWEGEDESRGSWESVVELFQEEKDMVITFCMRKGLEPDLLKSLQASQ